MDNLEINTARVWGNIACANGKKRVPAFDSDLNAMLSGRAIGESTAIVKAWLEGWDEIAAIALAGLEKANSR
jgi:hypothetical protein